MTHLGSQVSALADGQLAPAAAERALAHVAGCGDCAADLRAARAAHRALAAAMDVPMRPDLTERLLAVGSSGRECAPTPPAQASRFGDASMPLPGARGGTRIPADCLRGDLDRRRQVPTRLLAVTSVGLGAFVAALLVLGDQPTVVPSAHPAEALTLLGRAPTAAAPGPVVPDLSVAGAGAGTGVGAGDVGRRSDDIAAVDAVELTGADVEDRVLTWMDEHGWACPVSLPEGYRITGLRHDSGPVELLELDLVSPQGTVVVTQQRGRLAHRAVAGAPVLDLEGRDVHVLSTQPWHGVWQAGETVVSVVAEWPSHTVPGLVASYPADDYDDGVTARISRGWDALAGALDP